MDARTQPLSRGLCALAARPAGLLGRGRGRDRLDRAGEEGVRSDAGVYGRWFAGGGLQHLLERGRPPRACAAAASRRRSSTIRPSPGPSSTITYAELLAEAQMLAGDAAATSASPRATASSSTCRWCRRR